jgi:hypothetical protein
LRRPEHLTHAGLRRAKLHLHPKLNTPGCSLLFDFMFIPTHTPHYFPSATGIRIDTVEPASFCIGRRSCLKVIDISTALHSRSV